MLRCLMQDSDASLVLYGAVQGCPLLYEAHDFSKVAVVLSERVCFYTTRMYHWSR